MISKVNNIVETLCEMAKETYQPLFFHMDIMVYVKVEDICINTGEANSTMTW